MSRRGVPVFPQVRPGCPGCPGCPGVYVSRPGLMPIRLSDSEIGAVAPNGPTGMHEMAWQQGEYSCTNNQHPMYQTIFQIHTVGGTPRTPRTPPPDLRRYRDTHQGHLGHPHGAGSNADTLRVGLSPLAIDGAVR